MDAMTLGFLENGADVKVLTAATRKHPILMDELNPAYLESTDLEAVRIETQLDIRDAYVALMKGDSYNISRFYAHHYAMVVKRTLSRKRYDVVHLESLYTTPYIETIRRHAPNALISLRSHNHEYQIWEQRWKASRNPFHRLALRHLSKTLERYEKEVLNNVDVLVAISENEAMGYREWGYSGPIHVAGFGIDTSSRVPAPNVDSTPTDRPVRLFHLGAMDWGPNREGIAWFVDSVWPDLVKRHPGIEFHLAGKSLPPDLHTGVQGIVNHGEVADADAFAAGPAFAAAFGAEEDEDDAAAAGCAERLNNSSSKLWARSGVIINRAARAIAGVVPWAVVTFGCLLICDTLTKNFGFPISTRFNPAIKSC